LSLRALVSRAPPAPPFDSHRHAGVCLRAWIRRPGATADHTTARLTAEACNSRRTAHPVREDRDLKLKRNLDERSLQRRDTTSQGPSRTVLLVFVSLQRRLGNSSGQRRTGDRSAPTLGLHTSDDRTPWLRAGRPDGAQPGPPCRIRRVRRRTARRTTALAHPRPDFGMCDEFGGAQ
jgi:hypothetical protein